MSEPVVIRRKDVLALGLSRRALESAVRCGTITEIRLAPGADPYFNRSQVLQVLSGESMVKPVGMKKGKGSK